MRWNGVEQLKARVRNTLASQRNSSFEKKENSNINKQKQLQQKKMKMMMMNKYTPVKFKYEIYHNRIVVHKCE